MYLQLYTTMVFINKLRALDTLKPHFYYKFIIINLSLYCFFLTLEADQIVVDELDLRGDVFRTDRDDAACASDNSKIGTDADNKAGGCDNIRITLDGNVSANHISLSD